MYSSLKKPSFPQIQKKVIWTALENIKVTQWGFDSQEHIFCLILVQLQWSLWSILPGLAATLKQHSQPLQEESATRALLRLQPMCSIASTELEVFWHRFCSAMFNWKKGSQNISLSLQLFITKWREYTTFCLQLIWTAYVVITLKTNISPAERVYCIIVLKRWPGRRRKVCSREKMSPQKPMYISATIFTLLVVTWKQHFWNTAWKLVGKPTVKGNMPDCSGFFVFVFLLFYFFLSFITMNRCGWLWACQLRALVVSDWRAPCTTYQAEGSSQASSRLLQQTMKD